MEGLFLKILNMSVVTCAATPEHQVPPEDTVQSGHSAGINKVVENGESNEGIFFRTIHLCACVFGSCPA